MAKVLIQDAKQSKSRLSTSTVNAGARRRQFSSCDQCRKGKRACNIFTLGDGTDSVSRTCSNCSKTGKICTLEWLKSKDRTPCSKMQPPVNQNSMAAVESQDKAWDQYNWNYHEDSVPSPLDTIWDFPPSPAVYIYQQNSEFGKGFRTGPTHCEGDFPKEASYDQSQNPTLYIFDSDSDLAIEGSVSLSNASTISPSTNGLNGKYAESEAGVDEHLESSTPERLDYPERIKRRCSMPESSFRPTRQRASQASRRRSSFSLQRPPLCVVDPSSANLEYRLASSTNKSFISGNLMRIYHDSMENALSCWLTEKTCPYDVEVQPYVHGTPVRQIDMTNEWGPRWSNRICERVCSLDKACGGLRGRSLTSSEDRAVDMALRKAIMSFATQWAYSSSTVIISSWLRSEMRMSNHACGLANSIYF